MNSITKALADSSIHRLLICKTVLGEPIYFEVTKTKNGTVNIRHVFFKTHYGPETEISTKKIGKYLDSELMLVASFT